LKRPDGPTVGEVMQAFHVACMNHFLRVVDLPEAETARLALTRREYVVTWAVALVDEARLILRLVPPPNDHLPQYLAERLLTPKSEAERLLDDFEAGA